jgi:hypothetical protein
MERITNYMYEHTDDFKESNYLDIMRLLNKSPKPKEQYTCYWRNTDKFKYFQIKSSPEIVLSEYQVIDIMQHVINDDINTFMVALRNLVPANYKIKPDAIFKYQFIFPDWVDRTDRQKLHIMGAVTGKFRTCSKFIEIDYSTQWKKNLGIFIKDF